MSDHVQEKIKVGQDGNLFANGGILMNSARSMPSLAMLRAFDAFGRVGGIRKAALMLDVDHAVISRHLTALESFVGTALIDRSNGVRTLTSDGIEYHRRISAAFQEITNATVMLRKRHDQQLLIWASPGIAYHWLGPRLTASFNTEGSMGLELRPMDYAPDFAINEADGDIRYFRHGSPVEPPQGCRSVKISSPPVFPVASPNVAETAKLRLRSAQDLLNMRLLHEESDLEWRLWFSSQGLKVALSPLAGPRLWHAHVALEAAKRDQGIALANPYLVHNDLVSGQLVALEGVDHPFHPTRLGCYHFTARADRWNDRVVARFRNWLVSEAAR